MAKLEPYMGVKVQCPDCHKEIILDGFNVEGQHFDGTLIVLCPHCAHHITIENDEWCDREKI